MLRKLDIHRPKNEIGHFPLNYKNQLKIVLNMRLELKLVEYNKRKISWYWFWWHIDDYNIKSVGNRSKNRQMGLQQTTILLSKDSNQQSERETHRMAENICKIASGRKAMTNLVQFSCSVVSNSVSPWTAARQASVSITNSQSLLKLMSIESVKPSNHLIHS